MLVKWKGYCKETLISVPYSEIFDFKLWWEVLKISVPAGCTQYFKWLAFEVLTIMVGLFHDEN